MLIQMAIKQWQKLLSRLLLLPGLLRLRLSSLLLSLWEPYIKGGQRMEIPAIFAAILWNVGTSNNLKRNLLLRIKRNPALKPSLRPWQNRHHNRHHSRHHSRRHSQKENIGEEREEVRRMIMKKLDQGINIRPTISRLDIHPRNHLSLRRRRCLTRGLKRNPMSHE